MGKATFTEIELVFLAEEHYAGFVALCPRCRAPVEHAIGPLTERPLCIRFHCPACEGHGEFVSPLPVDGQLPGGASATPAGQPVRCAFDRAWLLPPDRTGDPHGRWTCPICGVAVQRGEGSAPLER